MDTKRKETSDPAIAPDQDTREVNSTYRSPSADVDVDQWAQRERKRREAWLHGPTDQEKRDYAQRLFDKARASGPANDEAAEYEVECWAQLEHKRRQEWIAGPSDEEKFEYIRNYRRRSERNRASADCPPSIEPERIARKLTRETELASKGLASSLLELPFVAWSRLIKAGQDWEAEYYQPTRRSRISYSDD